MFQVSTDPAHLNVPLIHAFLSQESHWARGIPLKVLQRAIDHSLCFGGYLGGQQVAFARVVSDFATFANLLDVFVVAEHRGHGFSRRLLHEVVSHPKLQGLRRFTLTTTHAHGLYAAFGFAAPRRPDALMERYCPDVYGSAAA